MKDDWHRDRRDLVKLGVCLLCLLYGVHYERHIVIYFSIAALAGWLLYFLWQWFELRFGKK